jgi:peroxiredoxin
MMSYVFSFCFYANIVDLRSWRRRSKSDPQLVVKSLPVDTMSNESDEEVSSSQEPRSKSTMVAPGPKKVMKSVVTEFSLSKLHRRHHSKKSSEKDMQDSTGSRRSASLKKPSTKSISPVGSGPSTPGSSPRSLSPGRSGSASKPKTKKRKQSRGEAKTDGVDSEKGRIPLLALLRATNVSPISSISSGGLPLDESESDSSGESTPQAIAPKRSKRSMEMIKQSADKIDHMVEKIASKVTPGEEDVRQQAKQIASELHKSHGDEICSIAQDLEVENDVHTPRNAQPTILTLPDELWHLRLVDAQDGVEKSIEELTKQSKAPSFVLVFLRQFGCIFCRRRLSDLVELKPLLDARGVQLIAIGNGSLKAAKKVLGEFGLTCPVLLDQKQKSYRLMNLHRGIRAALLNAKTMAKIGETFRMGFKQGRSSGDQLQLGGFFVCQGTRVTFAHPDRYSGDTVDHNTISAVCEN